MEPIMTYSTIRQKTGTCACGCGYEGLLTGGKSPNCYWRDIRLKSAAKKGEVAPTTTNLYDRGRAKKQPIEGLGQWFRDRREEMTGACLESGRHTSKYHDVYFVFSICHILPKSLFPSVATHPENWIELHVDSHTKFDSSWDTASKMGCFAEAKRKFKLFEHLIAPEERRRIPEQLLS
jgi:hypothetical protein